MKPEILITTPIKHINGLEDILKKEFNLFMEEETPISKLKESKKIIATFTNPNQLTYNLDKNFFNLYPSLKIICTASTGTNHIDKDECFKRNIKIISITEERDTINKISSTAEHAFALTLSALRNIPFAFNSVKDGKWAYTPFIGRQFSELTIGVIGYGRLGKFYSNYCDSFGAKILVYDPNTDVVHPRIIRVHSLNEIALNCDVVSLHAHVNKSTIHLIDKEFFKDTKENLLLVNTSRGEIVKEKDLLKFLKLRPKMKYATDVLEGEFTLEDSKYLIDYAKKTSQVIITPHIAGMTSEAQEIAYKKAAELLIRAKKEFLS
tara:strand:- start:1498 stop:2460 length:963 start_codon:yes stop_codon:yes gene_type:complete